MENAQHWMFRNRSNKPLSLSAQLAAMTAERDGLLKRVEAAEELAEAIGHNVKLLSTDNPLPTRAEWEAATELVKQALAVWRAADGG